jgi:hypothetical protein
LVRGKIGAGSYVPNGLTAAQYQKIRDQEVSKKKNNYERNVKKAGIFEDYTEFYVKRGTDISQNWYKSATRGHRMAMTISKLERKNLTISELERMVPKPKELQRSVPKPKK